VLLHIKLPKMTTLDGDFVAFFPFPELPCCPVTALSKLYWQQREAGLTRPSDAVFTFTSGKQLTRDGLNAVLKQLLEPLFDFSLGSISCHNFRAALPSALAACPGAVSAEDIKNWGCWRSDAYQMHTRLKQDQKTLYEKFFKSL
jgi:hypothetical protein